MDDIEQNYTPRETAGILRTTENTLKWQRHTSTGPAFVKVGRRVLYPRSAIEAYLAAGRREPQSVA